MLFFYRVAPTATAVLADVARAMSPFRRILVHDVDLQRFNHLEKGHAHFRLFHVSKLEGCDYLF
jgi:hypothetical protein